ncbi:hypothetical protein [Pseudomonas putida]|uniref:Uncharacterized protein n=1 Tax=Pseudomonas putida TaxID=303 RepID=A0A6I6XSI0_PSEPU|nr:hypothetical protein [Pseudomonas putida]QHG63107.1 hypothetical protein C2H86_01180 [Pseudomonas putida]
MGLILWAATIAMVLTVTFTPLVLVSLFILTMLGGDDSLVNPLVGYGVLPASIIITLYLMYRYGRRIADFLQSISSP